jgi:two-component system response regulator NreC
MAGIRVLLVDDHAIVRAGVRSLLAPYRDIEVVGEASDAEEAMERVESLHPDVVLMDLRLKGTSGLDAIHELKKKRMAETNIVVLTMVDAPQYFFPVLEAGACGYLLKESDPDELLAAIRAAARGEVFLTPAVARVVLEDYRAQKGSGEDSYATLSERERQVVRLTAEGHPSREIAERLFLSRKTVEKYRASALEKLGLHSRAELINYALSKGLLGTQSLGQPSERLEA